MRAPGLSLLLLVACSRPGVPGPLPDVLTSVVRLQDGSYLSLAVNLPRPGGAPAPMVSPGVAALGPGWARALVLEERGERWVAQFNSLGPESALASGSYAHRPSLVGLSADGAWLRTDDRSEWLGSAQHDGTATAGGSLRRPGPGHGFAVRVLDHRLEVFLPKMDVNVWAPLLHDVDALIGSWWLTRDDLPEWERALLDERFHRMAVIAAGAGSATVDGRLDEWRGARAVPVDQPGHVLQGHVSWSGPRDASFGVAARRDGDRVFLAIRLRDDAVVPGQDQICVLTPTGLLRWPVPESPEVLSGVGWRAAFSGSVDFGFAVEAELYLPGLPPDQLVLPLAVQFRDRDPGQVPTVIGTADAREMGLFDYVVADTQGPQ